MRIGLVTQWYEPEAGSAAHPTAIARALVERGHEVRVLTAFPSYPEGRVHSGYRMQLSHRETRNGIEVLRVPDVPSHDQNPLRRALSLTSFAASATARVGFLRGSDVVLTYLTPATVGVASWWLRRTRGVPHVLYVQDLWPETVTASGFVRSPRLAGLVEGALHAMLGHLYRSADGIAAISPSMARTLADRGSTVGPISIPNWVSEDVFRPADPGSAPQLPTDVKWIMYAGGIGELQALDHAVRAIALLDDRPDIGLALVGDGVARPGLERLAREMSLTNRVRFLGPRPMEQMPALMAEAAAQLISLRDFPLFRGTIPSKIQASMACGAPVVCAVAGDAAELVRRSDAGLVVRPESASGLADAFRRLIDMTDAERQGMGNNGLLTYRNELCAAVGVMRLERLLQTASGKTR